MKAAHIERILNNLDKLVATNGLLAESNYKALDMATRSQKDKDQLLTACREIYEGLEDKENRSLAEESWYKGLKEVLQQTK